MKRKLLIGTVISAVFLYLALRGIQWSVLWGVVQRTHVLYLIPTVFFTVLGLYFRSFRWHVILLPIKDIRISGLFAAVSVGFMANNILPARLGEFVRAHIVGKAENISRTASFATIIYERIVDVFTLLALLGLTMLQISGPGWLQTSAVTLLSLNVALLVLLSIMRRHPEGFKRAIVTISRRLPNRAHRLALHMTTAFLSGLAVMGNARQLLPIAVASLLAWGATIAAAYFCLEALEIHLPVSASLAVVVIVSMGSMIPSAPAYVGTTQYACILALSLYGVDKNEALAFSLLFHASQFVPITILGFYYLAKSRVRLSEILKPSDQ